ncbi:hypothetical protein K1719_046956 [Acacia pycnantha]|nr:hypothetical protein K1719_046956 [Acacia pycnantha]
MLFFGYHESLISLRGQVFLGFGCYESGVLSNVVQRTDDIELDIFLRHSITIKQRIEEGNTREEDITEEKRPREKVPQQSIRTLLTNTLSSYIYIYIYNRFGFHMRLFPYSVAANNSIMH